MAIASGFLLYAFPATPYRRGLRTHGERAASTAVPAPEPETAIGLPQPGLEQPLLEPPQPGIEQPLPEVPRPGPETTTDLM